MLEKWDLYTQHREYTGEEQIRGEIIPENYFHLVVHVWIRNADGQYLISRRAADRPTFPLMYECVGGSVLKGEQSLEGAIREVKEEVGIDLLPSQGKLLFTTIRREYSDILDVWLFEYDGEVDLQKATSDEVAECAWMNCGEIRRLFDAGKLVDTLDYFFCVLEAPESDYSD